MLGVLADLLEAVGWIVVAIALVGVLYEVIKAIRQGGKRG